MQWSQDITRKPAGKVKGGAPSGRRALGGEMVSDFRNGFVGNG
jgi:hypothetical protein